MFDLKDAMQYAAECYDELLALVRELCAIPAPSHQEDQRAAFCLHWFQAAGGKDAYIDEAKNVICPVGVEGEEPVAIFMAHTDTVFPDLEPLPFSITDDGVWHCPGICDDTSNLAVMMLCARYALRHGGRGLLFVANSCEEGLGNLKGSRQLMKDFGARTLEVVSFDGFAHSVTNRAVGSTRYRITVRTEGGHSYENFGNRSAIQVLAGLIQEFYATTVPAGGKTSYNVGAISGGTSVNTIAQQAEMLYEYRSDEVDNLSIMRGRFERTIETHRAAGEEIEVELLGERPCAANVDPEKERALTDRCQAAMREVYGENAPEVAASTDCNIPLSMGIPSISTGVCVGNGAHTRQEYLVPESLREGMQIALRLVGHWL